jgi:hypothetical protein
VPLAARFEEMADQIAGPAKEFVIEAHVPDGSFGRLPSAEEAHASYSQKVQEMSASLQQVEATVRQFATDLHAVATNWQVTEEDNTMGGH